MPMKTLVSTSSGHLLWGTEQSDSQRRISLKGKVWKISLKEYSMLWTSHWYLCNDRCYKNIKHLEKKKEEARVLKNEMKSSFSSANWIKHDVLSDSYISGSIVASTKSPCHLANARPKMAKSIIFQAIVWSRSRRLKWGRQTYMTPAVY